MTTLTKGATVRVLKAGTAPGAGSGRSEWMKKDEEVEVRHVYKDGSIKVRSTLYGSRREVVLQPGNFSAPLRPLGQMPEGAISPDDPGLDWLWEDAQRVADMSGFCTEYDRLLNVLKVPGRLRMRTVRIASADGIEIQAKIMARSQRQAEQRLRDQLSAHTINHMSIDGQSAEMVLATLEEEH